MLTIVKILPKNILWVLVSVLIGASGPAIGAEEVKKTESSSLQEVMLTPGDMQWMDGPPVLPGAKMAVIEGDLKNPGPFTMRIKAPANSKLPPHWHPAIEHVTVISGTFHVGMGERFDPAKAKALPVGGFMAMPPKVPHFAFFKDETVIQIHGIGPWGLNFVNPADDPRKK